MSTIKPVNSNKRKYKKAIIRHKRNKCLVLRRAHFVCNKGVVVLFSPIVDF